MFSIKSVYITVPHESHNTILCVLTGMVHVALRRTLYSKLKENRKSLLTYNDEQLDAFINPGTPYGTYMSHVFFLHLLHEYNKKTYFKLSPILL